MKEQLYRIEKKEYYKICCKVFEKKEDNVGYYSCGIRYVLFKNKELADEFYSTYKGDEIKYMNDRIYGDNIYSTYSGFISSVSKPVYGYDEEFVPLTEDEYNKYFKN